MPSYDAEFLGIDFGTSNVKAVLVDRQQQVVASASVALETSRPHSGWSEQSPEAWWQALRVAIDQLRGGGASLRGVRALGLSGQMHGLVLLDADDHVLRPAMLWNDARAGEEAERFAKQYPQFDAVAGAAQSPSFWPAKLLWLQRHEAHIFAASRHLLLPKDYIRLRLTGLYRSDPSDAGSTLLLDQAARSWSAPIAEACGITLSHLPDLVEGSHAAGQVLDGVCDDWGMQRGVLMAGGGGDAALGAIGIGAIRDGEAIISLGTSSQIFVSTGSYRPAEAAGVQAFAHALPGLWFQAAAVLNGASALAWAARMLGRDDPGALLAEAEAQYGGPGRLLFLPYLTGERTPHNDPQARGVLFGLTPECGAAQITQAVIEGVAYSLADALDVLLKAGTHLSEASLIGGGARSAFWTRIIADILGIAVQRHAGVETGPAFGAARLARLAFTGESFEAVCVAPPVLDRTLPDPTRHAAYRVELARYRALYQALRPEFRRGMAGR